jgi:hypothetical protein
MAFISYYFPFKERITDSGFTLDSGQLVHGKKDYVI